MGYYETAVGTAEKLKDTAGHISSIEHMDMIKAGWEDLEAAQEANRKHDYVLSEKLCLSCLEKSPINGAAFCHLIDAIIKQNDLLRAALEVKNRYMWMLRNAYHVHTVDEAMGFEEPDFEKTMSYWISDYSKLLELRDDVHDKINRGYVYRPRKKKSENH